MNTFSTIYPTNDSETFSKTILESSPDCLKILDQEGKLQYMNYNGLCLMEIDDFSALKEQYWWSLWGRENEELVKNSVTKAMNGDVAQFSAFCPTAKGTPKWWDVTVLPVGNKECGITQILSVSRDITAQKIAEEEIKKLNNELEQKVAERTKELREKNDILNHTIEDLAKFNYIASHDLQEPLRKIQTFSKLIKEKGLPDAKTQMYFDRILVATERMRSLIESLHSFSVTRNENLKIETCDLNEMLAEIEEQISEQISGKNAQIQYDNRYSVRGTKILLHQLLTNLVQNSLKYSKEDVPPIITICTEEVLLNEKPFIKIVVKDNGIGIDNSYKDKIFDLFQRLHQKNEYSGTGIGLTICKNIVQKHNGFIEADGIPNEGTTFTIHLPK